MRFSRAVLIIALMLCQYVMAQSSSGEVSSSSISLSSSFDQIVTDKDWEADNTARTRCSFVNKDTVLNQDPVTLEGDTVQTCFNPFTLDGAVLRVPNNTTRIDKDGFSLCQIEQGDYVPTIVVYIYDHSGSMGPNNGNPGNDPDQIADDAFRNAIAEQAVIDPQSYAAYLPFAATIIESDTVEPIQLNTQANINKLQAAMNHDYGGNTNFFDPLVQAEEFLARPEYDGFNKAIIMLADGEDRLSQGQTDNLVALPNFPAVYGIFLGANTTGEDRMNSVSEATGAYSTQIDNADGVAPLISQLIKDLVVVANPINITLENTSLVKTRFANFDDMEQQLDGSWVLNFNNDIPLKEYANEMTMKTTYQIGDQKIASDPISFTIQVTGDIVNEGIEIDETAFGTQCVEFTSIEIFEDNSNQLGELENRADSLLIRLNALEEDEIGDSAKVMIISKETKDTIFLDLFKVFDNDTNNTYESFVQVQWTDSLIDGVDASKLLLSPFDQVVVKKVNEVDPRDLQKANFTVRISPNFYFEGDTLKADSIPLTLQFFEDALDSIDVKLNFLDTTISKYFLSKQSGLPFHYRRVVGLSTAFLLTDIPSGEFELEAIFTDPKTGFKLKDTVLVIRPDYPLDSKPQEIVLFDRNQDARLDSIRIPYTDTINRVIKESYSYTLTWPNKEDSVETFEIDSEWISSQSKSDINDQIEYLLNDYRGFNTTETGLTDAWGDVVLTQTFVDDFGSFEREWDDLPVIDSMAPILISSEITWVEDGVEKDELVITFSEQMDTTITNVEELFNFILGTNDEIVYYGDDYQWREDGKVFVIFFSGEELDHTTQFNPRDQVQAIVGDGFLKDNNGLSVGNSDEWTNVDGGFNERIEVTKSSVFDLTEEFSQREDIETEVYQGYENAIEIMENQKEQGMVLGPIKVNENDKRSPEDIRWRYQFLVFDHLGQFVTRKYGVIECTSEYFQADGSTNCKDSRGIKIGLKWNYKNKDGRFVGTGVYILGLQVENRPLVTNKVAVRRTTEVQDIEIEAN